MGAEPTLHRMPSQGWANGVMMLSTALGAGTSSTEFGADAWPVSATETVVLTNTRTVPPENSISLVDLLPRLFSVIPFGTFRLLATLDAVAGAAVGHQDQWSKRIETRAEVEGK
jgi:hypothetical protein